MKKTIKSIKSAATLRTKAENNYKNNDSFRQSADYTEAFTKKKIKKKTILFETFHGSSMGDNPYAIFLEMLNNPIFSEFHFVWTYKELDEFPYELFSKMSNIEFVKIYSKKYIDYLATAEYLVNNTTFPPYFQKKKGQIYVNTWHGTPLKTLGKDMKGSMGQHKNIQRNFMHADYIVSPNSFTTDILVSSHDLSGIYQGKIIEEGYPRIDLTDPGKKTEILERLSLEIDEQKKIILYAPTWRGEVGGVENTYTEIIQVVTQLQQEMPDDYQLLLKVHTLVYKKISNRINKEEIILVPNSFDTNELLSAVDILITDYSSIMFDFLITGKPIILFAYDYESYEKNRGLYLDMKSMGLPFCSNVLEVMDELNRANQHVTDGYLKLQKKYSKLNMEGGVTKKYIDIIFNKNEENYNIRTVENNKKNIFVYAGGFMNNGITTSFINLSDLIDYDKYNLILVEKGNLSPEEEDNIKKLNKKTKIFYRVGSTNVTISEWPFFSYSLKKYETYKSKMPIFKKIYRREFDRIFGAVHKDIVMDFSGYVPFWAQVLGYSDATKKIIFQHNDMWAERKKVINGKKVHQKLDVIFGLYSVYDKIACVGKKTMESNIGNLEKYAGESKYVYTPNILNHKKIKKMADEEENIFTHNGSTYLMLDNEKKSNRKVVVLPREEDISFVNVGRHSPEKGQEKLIYAFKNFLRGNEYLVEHAKLYMLGEGVLTSSLKSIVSKNNLENNIIFSGQLENPFVIMKHCDCYISSSNHEGQPMVLLEALALKMDIIATDIEGNRSVLEDEFGLVVENTQQGIEEALDFYHMDFGNSEIQKEKFNDEAYDEHVLAIYEKLFNEK